MARREDGPVAGRGIGLFLAGDVMIGRGVDQVLEQSVPPPLHEPHVESARRYVELAEEANGPVPDPVAPSYPWGDALGELSRLDPDVRIVNLETALTTGGEARTGKGIHYRAHPANTACLTAAGVDVAVLANNHVLDWGRAGLEETIRALEAAGIATAGAGPDLSEARAPARVGPEGTDGDGGGTAAGVLVFGAALPSSGVPRSWTARPGEPGVNLLPGLGREEARALGEGIRERRGPDDVVVVSLHWGRNWGHRIPRRQRRFARWLIDEAGVDVVHGHSSHHPKGIEVHAGRPVLYGCGDLLNDYEGIRGHEDYRPDLRLAYFVGLAPGSGRLRHLELVPFRMRRFRLETASAEESRWLRRTLNEQSRGLEDGVRLEEDGAGRLRLP